MKVLVVSIVIAILASMIGVSPVKAQDGLQDYCAHATAAGFWCSEWAKAPIGSQFQKNCLKTVFGACVEYTMTPIGLSAPVQSEQNPAPTKSNPEIWNEVMSGGSPELREEHPEYFESLTDALNRTCNGKVEEVALTTNETLSSCEEASNLPVNIATTVGLTLIPDPSPVNEVVALGKLKGVIQGIDGTVKVAILLGTFYMAGKAVKHVTVTVQANQSESEAIALGIGSGTPALTSTEIMRYTAQHTVVINNIHNGTGFGTKEYEPSIGSSNGTMSNKYMNVGYIVESIPNLCQIWFRADLPKSDWSGLATVEHQPENKKGPCNPLDVISALLNLGKKAMEAGVGVEVLKRLYTDVFTQICLDFNWSFAGDYIVKLLGW